MAYIDLFENGKNQGRFNLPENLRSQTSIYKIGRATLGGGNGVVFHANKMTGLGRNGTGTPCAVKMLRQLSTQRVDRFLNEVRVLKELDSPKISKYHDDGKVTVTLESNDKIRKEIHWVAMQLGGDNMRQHIESNGPLPVKMLKIVADEICQAVSHLHGKGFIHRDIKPDNFVWSNPDKAGLLMIDFGIAKKIGEDVSARPMDTFTQVTEFVGPVFFSSPELIEYAANKLHPVDFRSDIFQIGKLIWFLGTGKISAGVPARRECPAGGLLRQLVIDMIDDDPDSRIQTLAEVQERIAAIPD